MLQEGSEIGLAGRARACKHASLAPRVRPGRGLDFLSTFIKMQKPSDKARWPLHFGGGGGNRTRVRKPSTGGSTYLA
jgi:hypothetical protein